MKSFAYVAGLTAFVPLNCGVRNCSRFGSFQTEKRVTTPKPGRVPL